MFRRRDEDEVEYTLQPSNKNIGNTTGSGFHAASQAPGQTINSQPVAQATTYAPNNMPYNPAAHSFAQSMATQSQAPQDESEQPAPQASAPSYVRSNQAALVQETAPQRSEREQTPREAYREPARETIRETVKETKTSTPKPTASMNTFVPSAIRASSNQNANQNSNQNQGQQQYQPQAQNQAPKQQPLKVDNIGLETERRLTVGYGISLEGKVSDCDKLVIYGNVNAELNNVKALQISDSGCFRGAAEIDYAEISGVFEGEIRVRKNIVISSTGRVSGKITYNSIEIKPGGKFTGEIIEAKSEFDVASGSSDNESRANEARQGEDLNLFTEQKAENRAA